MPQVNKKGKRTRTFVEKLHDLVSDPSTDNIVVWSSCANGEVSDSFSILDPQGFTAMIVPQFCLANSDWDSFLLKLDEYAFNYTLPSADKLLVNHEFFRQNSIDLLAHFTQNEAKRARSTSSLDLNAAIDKRPCIKSDSHVNMGENASVCVELAEIVLRDPLKESDNQPILSSSAVPKKRYSFPHEFPPSEQAAFVSDIERKNNVFTKGVKFSPDGLCLLTSSEDKYLRLFEVDKIEDTVAEAVNDKACQPVLQSKEGGTIYDFQWYPFMSSYQPDSCFFVATSQDHPIHLWDAYNGTLRATYRAFNHLDENDPAFSVAFNSTGDKIYAGFNRTIRYFDISRPSRSFRTRALCKSRKSRIGQRGMISTINFNPDHSKVYAAGSYNGSTCIYTEDTGEELMAFQGHAGGITQVQFSPDGRYLLTGARKDNKVVCWDIRNTTNILHTFERMSSSNQRVAFDIHQSSNFLITGSQDCKAMVYNLLTGEMILKLENLPDCANGVSFLPDVSKYTVAISTGQRHFQLSSDMEDYNTASSSNDFSSVQIWDLN